MLDYIKRKETRTDLLNYLKVQGVPLTNTQNLSAPLPNKLYRYGKLDEYTIANLTNKELTITAPKLFNDIYDSVIHRNSFPYIEQELKDINALSAKLGYDPINMDMDYLKRDFAQRDRHYMTYMTEPMRIACFSENAKSILMWSHYADMNRGICIEYDFTQSPLISPMMYPVIYMDNPVDMSDICENPKDNDLEKSVLLSTLIKSDVWSYEKEWRYVFYMITPKPLPERCPIINIPKPTKIYLGRKFLETWIKQGANTIFDSFCAYIKKENIPVEVIYNDVLSFNLSSKPVSIDLVKGLDESKLYEDYLL